MKSCFIFEEKIEQKKRKHFFYGTVTPNSLHAEFLFFRILKAKHIFTNSRKLLILQYLKSKAGSELTSYCHYYVNTGGKTRL